MLSPSSGVWLSRDNRCGLPTVNCSRLDVAVILCVRSPKRLACRLSLEISARDDATGVLEDPVETENETGLTAELFAGVYEV